MRRREFLGVLGTAAAWPMVARAQQPARPVVGWLSSVSPEGYGHVVQPFREGLKEIGYTDGENVDIEYRWARDQIERLPEFARDLVRSRVALIVAAGGTQTALAAKAATTTIPIVFLNGSDPVKVGLVASLNQPGGNITGMTLITIQLVEKRLELARELVPEGPIIGLLLNRANPNAAVVSRDAKAAGQSLERQVLVFEVGNANDLPATFSAIGREKVGALVITADPMFTDHGEQLVALATRHAIPTIYGNRDSAVAGGLMSYGTSRAEAYRVIGKYAGRILAGERPANLPVLQPTKFELAINLKTAKALGLTISPSLLARADEVIE